MNNRHYLYLAALAVAILRSRDHVQALVSPVRRRVDLLGLALVLGLLALLVDLVEVVFVARAN